VVVGLSLCCVWNQKLVWEVHGECVEVVEFGCGLLGLIGLQWGWLVREGLAKRHNLLW